MKIFKTLKIGKVVFAAIMLVLVVFSSLSVMGIDINPLNTFKDDQSIQTSSQTQDAYAASGSPKTIRVLIYNGYDTLPSSVNGIKSCLNYANTHNSVSNVKFAYSTSKVINSATLSSYDVLIMPGGTSGKSYLRNPNINSKDLKKFVTSGKGYVGICAGAYAASYRVYGYYYGWGIAPNVNCRVVNYVGQLPVSMTSSGSSILKYSGIQTLYHWNGPAMYKKSTANTLAKYANRKTGYVNYDSIVTDNYGSGRVVLSGPHPELAPAKPGMLARMITYAAKQS